MEKDDIQQVKEILKDSIEEIKSTLENQFQIFKIQLDTIQKDVSKMNNQIEKNETDIVNLKLDDKNHYINCPQNAKIELLQKEVNQVVTSKKFLIGTLSVYTLVIGLIVTLIKIFA